MLILVCLGKDRKRAATRGSVTENKLKLILMNLCAYVCAVKDIRVIYGYFHPTLGLCFANTFV